MQTETVEVRKIVADDGKVFAQKSNGKIQGRVIYLGKEDSPDNYVEVDIPEEVESVDAERI